MKWTEVTPASAFTLRSRLIDKTKATDWLVLAKFGWSIGATSQSRSAIDHAVQMDPSLKSQASEITAAPAGSAVTDSTKPSGELIGTDGQTRGMPANSPANSPRRPDSGQPDMPSEKYRKASAAEDEEAIDAAKKMAASVGQEFGVDFKTIETPHFLVFTDWDPLEYDFLKTNLEDAYTDVTNQFQIPASENVFVGKLPVLMFARFEPFRKMTDSLNFLGRPCDKMLQGYYMGKSDGSGRLVMYKPSAGEKTQSELRWAHTLVHEFTHAFIARYRTNASIPRWLNEGTADLIAAEHFPYANFGEFVKRMAAEHKSPGTLFDDKQMPTGEWYPVMQTLVEYLVHKNHDTFLKMFDAIKGGMSGEEAITKFYDMDYDSMYQHWRNMVLKGHE